VRKLRRLYVNLVPALHQKVMDTSLDLGALAYAVRRLPTNVTGTPAWYLTDELPPSLRKADNYFPPVASSARRRGAWQMFPGKNLIVIRNGLTDAMDLVSCLCALATEGKKIRHRISKQHSLSLIRQNLDQVLKPEDLRRILGEVGFLSPEVDTFYSLWKDQALQRIWELFLLHEDLFLLSQKQTDIYHGRRTERWSSEVIRGAEKLLGIKLDDWPSDLEVHLISSNTHSVTNCLSPGIYSIRAEVMDWARDTQHPHLKSRWSSTEDLFYSLLGDFLKNHKNEEVRNKDEFAQGILRLNDSTATGIQAQIIDPSRMASGHYDSGINIKEGGTRKLIINIDYAFGEQAEEILRGLLPSLRHHIKGFYVIGKAGALVGDRGDIMIPTAFLLQREDRLFPLNQSPEILDTVGDHKVRYGPMLTVEGTLLQNRPMLNFYQRVYQTLGLEMEGYYYARELQSQIQQGILAPSIRQKYYYYTSDLPLDTEANLSRPMGIQEGIPPLYALTRMVLNSILS